LPSHLAGSGWLMNNSNASMNSPERTPHAAPRQRSPSQQKQVRSFAEKDVMAYIRDK